MIDLKNALKGSGGTPINSVVTIRSVEPVYMDGTTEYLRSGYIETNVSLYPDATRSVGASLGGTYPVIASPDCTCFDGTYHWVGSATSDIIRQYDINWTATGLTKNIGIKPRGLAWDSVNSQFWAVRGVSGPTPTAIARKYDVNWTYLGTQIDVTSKEPSARGITVDGTYVYIIGTATDYVYRYTVAGAFVDDFFDVSSVTNVPSDILLVGTNFWVTSRFSQIRGGIIAEFDATGIPTGRRFTPIGDNSSMDFDGTYFWSTRYDGTVWQYSGEYVGMPQYEPSGNGTKYMRVK
jgi:hypothetical protein